MKDLIISLKQPLIKSTEAAITCLLFSVLLACSNEDRGNVKLASDTQLGIPMPDALRTAAIAADGTLSAFLYCDEIEHSMAISGGVAQGSCTSLSTDIPHSIRVEFVFSSNIFGPKPFLVATASKSPVQVSTGVTTLNFVQEDFLASINSLDDDGDQIPNLVELEAGADPGDSICFFGLSKIDHCTL